MDFDLKSNNIREDIQALSATAEFGVHIQYDSPE